MKQSSSIPTPNKSDIVCGRGGLSNKHPGNRLFRRLVNRNKALYQRRRDLAPPLHKQFICRSIVEAIRKQGGRFVELKNKEWVEISIQKAHRKTSQALRELNNDDVSGDSSTSCSTSQSQSSRSSSFQTFITTADEKYATHHGADDEMMTNNQQSSTTTVGHHDAAEDDTLSSYYLLPDQHARRPPSAAQEYYDPSSSSSSSSKNEVFWSERDDFEPIPAITMGLHNSSSTSSSIHHVEEQCPVEDQSQDVNPIDICWTSDDENSFLGSDLSDFLQYIIEDSVDEVCITS